MMRNVIIVAVAVLVCGGCFSPQIHFADTPSTSPVHEQWKEALVVDILSRTSELNIHRMNGQTKNQVFLHKDGHGEAVFDEDGVLVKDPVNQGSYNYYHPVKKPLAHFAKDIHPWFKWGNTRDDPSTPEQRLSAYMKDLRLGIMASLEARAVQPGKETVLFSSRTECDVALLFLQALAADGNSLFQMYENPESFTEARLNQLLETVEQELRKEI